MSGDDGPAPGPDLFQQLLDEEKKAGETQSRMSGGMCAFGQDQERTGRHRVRAAYDDEDEDEQAENETMRARGRGRSRTRTEEDYVACPHELPSVSLSGMKGEELHAKAEEHRQARINQSPMVSATPPVDVSLRPDVRSPRGSAELMPYMIGMHEETGSILARDDFVRCTVYFPFLKGKRDQCKTDLLVYCQLEVYNRTTAAMLVREAMQRYCDDVNQSLQKIPDRRLTGGTDMLSGSTTMARNSVTRVRSVSTVEHVFRADCTYLLWASDDVGLVDKSLRCFESDDEVFESGADCFSMQEIPSTITPIKEEYTKKAKSGMRAAHASVPDLDARRHERKKSGSFDEMHTSASAKQKKRWWPKFRGKGKKAPTSEPRRSI